MFNTMIDIQDVSRCVIQTFKSVRFILHALLLDYISSSVHVKNLPPTASKKTRGPEVAPSVSRSIFISCHDNAHSVTFESGPEGRTDTTIWRELYIYNKCHTCTARGIWNTNKSTRSYASTHSQHYNLNIYACYYE